MRINKIYQLKILLLLFSLTVSAKLSIGTNAIGISEETGPCFVDAIFILPAYFYEFHPNFLCGPSSLILANSSERKACAGFAIQTNYNSIIFSAHFLKKLTLEIIFMLILEISIKIFEYNQAICHFMISSTICYENSSTNKFICCIFFGLQFSFLNI